MKFTNQVPLFISRFSLSPRTAIGVQTLRLISPHEDWLHFHWWSSDLRQLDRRSILFENTILSRYSFLHNPKLMQICERLKIGSWIGNDLRPEEARRLTRDYQERVSKAYMAPLDEWDAIRCLQLVKLVQVPFVLHLWDVLEGDVHRGALRELIERAEQVFCVSDPLLRDICVMRPDAELLSFSRDPSLSKAAPPAGGPLRVAMHGNVSSYADGLDDLEKAIALLEAEGRMVEVSFFGSPRILRRAKSSLLRRVQVNGFLSTQHELDRLLAQAHVAFLPGPKRDPADDMRSRYSIPSRILDYLAVGLPVVGCVHPGSATAGFVRKLGLGGTACSSGPQEIATWLRRLAQPDVWAQQNRRSLEAFALHSYQEAPPQKLKRTLDRIA